MDPLSVETSLSSHEIEPPAISVQEGVAEDTTCRTLEVRIRRGILRLAPGRIRDLKVDVRQNRVVLQGQCSSYYSKQLAQQVAMELACGGQVTNRIEVW